MATSSKNESNQNIDHFEQARLERLKYNLQQQDFLNRHSHRYLVVFQTMMSGIVLSVVARIYELARTVNNARGGSIGN